MGFITKRNEALEGKRRKGETEDGQERSGRMGYEGGEEWESIVTERRKY